MLWSFLCGNLFHAINCGNRKKYFLKQAETYQVNEDMCFNGALQLTHFRYIVVVNVCVGAFYGTRNSENMEIFQGIMKKYF